MMYILEKCHHGEIPIPTSDWLQTLKGLSPYEKALENGFNNDLNNDGTKMKLIGWNQ